MDVIKALFGSKKFLAALAGIIVVVADKAFGWQLPEDTILQVVGLIGAFVVGQGLADFGKESTKEAIGYEAEKAAAPTPAPVDPSSASAS